MRGVIIQFMNKKKSLYQSIHYTYIVIESVGIPKISIRIFHYYCYLNNTFFGFRNIMRIHIYLHTDLPIEQPKKQNKYKKKGGKIISKIYLFEIGNRFR